MAMGAPYVSVECDRCGDIAPGEIMTKIGLDSWDDREARAEFKRAGWIINGNVEAICPECLKASQKAAE